MPDMIQDLRLTDFRNHKTSHLNIRGKKNIIITGPNGAGKTAIIEAVSMLSGERGMRGAPMCDIARFDGNGGFSVFATLDNDDEVCVYFNQNDSNRHARVNGDGTPLSDLAKHMRIVWVTPREDRIFVDNATDRRAFFDRMAAGFDSAHSGRVARHNKLMSERAGALKTGANSKWIDALDAQIAATAVAIAAARIQYAGEVNYFLSDVATSVDGMVESMIMKTNAATAERNYLDYLKSNRSLTNDKMVLDGVNKSDFGVFNHALNLPAHLTSTGQQKTTLLDLVLAHAKLIHTKTNSTPIVLLDEAAAHLDNDARKRLFTELGNASAQVWATGIDDAIFKNVPNATFVACANGEISNIL
ncbi:MAG: AAA family ATPase [Alphaproteobacteria bacterium]|nr:AAA family ATPase [Alphaproteobacteria bacterium]